MKSKGLLKPYSASDWCDAILARKEDQIRWLAQSEEAKDVINDSFWTRGSEMAQTPLRFAILNGCSLERIRFLIEQAGAIPDADDICVARNRVDILYLLHTAGARHNNFFCNV